MPSPKNYLLHYAALPKYGDNSEKNENFLCNARLDSSFDYSLGKTHAVNTWNF